MMTQGFLAHWSIIRPSRKWAAGWASLTLLLAGCFGSFTLAWWSATPAAAFPAVPAPAPLHAQEEDTVVLDPAIRRTDRELRFLDGLRERGYFDLAIDWIESLRQAGDTPEELRQVLDYQTGLTHLDEAGRIADTERQRDLLEKARRSLVAFTTSYPKHPEAPAARIQFARLMIQRGDLNKYLADDASTEDDRRDKLTLARESFRDARKALDEAIAQLSGQLKTFPKFIELGDPRRRTRDTLQAALMQGEFLRATVDYAEGHTHPENDAKRRELLDAALKGFESLANRYRTQSIGLYAKMWQGKCYEESGRLGEAMGLYNQLLENRDPRLGDLNRKVGYFRIVALGKRGEYALAADEANRWLLSHPAYAMTVEGLGVQLQKAKNMIAQMEAQKDTLARTERDAATRVVRDTLRNVVRVYSPHKAEALELLQKYDPKSALRAEEVAKMKYDEASSAAEAAIQAGNFPEAINLLKHAINQAFVEGRSNTLEERSKTLDQANRARYLLSYAYYANGDFYESATLAEFLARRYPENGLAAKATEIGMAAHIGGYNTVKVDRASDLNRLLAFASYVAQRFADQDQGNAALMTIGQVEFGRGNDEAAIAAYDKVADDSARKPEAITRAAAARVRRAGQLRAQGQTAEADQLRDQAISQLRGATARLQAANTPSTDPVRIDAALVLADLLMNAGHPDEALQVIQPLARDLTAIASPPPPVRDRAVRVMATLMMANIQTGRTDEALKNIATLEQSNTPGDVMVRLYVQLGQLLETEMNAARQRDDTAKLARIQGDYQRFLSAVAANDAASPDILQWAGEAMLDLDMNAEAVDVLTQAANRLKEQRDGTTNLDESQRLNTRYERALLKLTAALRKTNAFDQAAATLKPLLDRSPPLMEAMFEDCRIATAQAAARRGNWNTALAKWVELTGRLRGLRPRPPEYFEAFYELAEAQRLKGDSAEARKTLSSILKLNRRTMSPEMAKRYENALNALGSGG